MSGVTFKLRERHRSGRHVFGQVFAGPDRHHLALAGNLTLTLAEWDALYRSLRSGAIAADVEVLRGVETPGVVA